MTQDEYDCGDYYDNSASIAELIADEYEVTRATEVAYLLVFQYKETAKQVYKELEYWHKKGLI